MTWSDPIVRYRTRSVVYLATEVAGEVRNVGSPGTLQDAGVRERSHTGAETNPKAEYTGPATLS
jgi:hypothetical protein